MGTARFRDAGMTARNPIPLILTAIGSVASTVAVLGFYGYLHFAKPEDALLLAEFTMLKTCLLYTSDAADE